MAVGDITLGTQLSITTNGTAWDNGFSQPQTLFLTDSKVISIYRYKASTSWAMRCKVGNISGTTVTWSSEKTILTFGSYGFTLNTCTALSDNTVVLYYTVNGYSSNTSPIRVITLDESDNLTIGAEYNAISTNTNQVALRIRKLASNRFVAAYEDSLSGSRSIGDVKIYNVSGTTISNVYTNRYKDHYGGATNDWVKVVVFSDNKFTLTTNNAGNYKIYRYDYTSGTMDIQSTAIPFWASYSTYLGNNKVVCFSGTQYIIVDVSSGLSVSDTKTTPTLGTIQQLNTWADSIGAIAVRSSTSVDQLLSIWSDSNNDLQKSTAVATSAGQLGSLDRDSSVSGSFNTNTQGWGILSYANTNNIRYKTFSVELSQPFDEEYTASGTITLSSSFDYSLDLSKSYTGSGTITLSSSFDYYYELSDYSYNGSGTIHTSSTFDYFETDNYNYSGTGDITLSSAFEYIFAPVVASYNANGLISSTSNFVYERDGKVKISDGYIFKDSSVYEGKIEWLTDTKFIIAYKGSNGYGYAKVGDVSGNTISYGAEYDFSGEVIDYFSVAILSSSSFVIAWNKGVNIYTLKYIVSGNVITHPIGVGTLINYANIQRLHVVYSGRTPGNLGDAVILTYSNKSRVIYFETSATEYSETIITTKTTFIPRVTRLLNENIICTYIYNNNPYITVGVRGNQTCTYSFETKLSNIITNDITNCIMLSDTKLLVTFTTSTKMYGVIVRMSGPIPVAVGDAIEFDSYQYLSRVSSLTSSYFLHTYNNKARVCSFSDISYSNTNISFGQSYDVGVLFTDLKSRNSTSLGFKEGASPSIYLLTQDLHVFDQHSNANGLINITSDFDVQVELSAYIYEGSGSIIIDSYSNYYEDYEGLFIKQIYGDIVISSNTETFRDPIITEANGLISLSADMQTFVNPIQTSANGIIHLSSDNKVLFIPGPEYITQGIISSLNQYNLGSGASDLQVCMLNETHGFVTNGSYARGFKYIYPNITWYGEWQQIYSGAMGIIEYEVIDTWSDRAGNGKIIISKTGTNWDISQINVVATSSNVLFYSPTIVSQTSGSTAVYSVSNNAILWHSGTNTLNLNIAGNNTIVQTSQYSRGKACYIKYNRILVVYTDYTKTYYKVYNTFGNQLSSGTLLNNIGGVEIDLKPFLNGEAIFATKTGCYRLALIGDDISIVSSASLGSYVYQPKIAVLNSYSGWVVVWNQDNIYENRQYISKNGSKGPLYQTQITSTCIAADSGSYTNFVTATENSDGINLKFYGMDAFYNKITPFDGTIRLSSAFAYRYYPDFFPAVDGITVYASSDVLSEVGFIYNTDGYIYTSSNIIPEVGFEYNVDSLITLSSDFTYNEANDYPYDINGQITLSSDFTYEEGNDYPYDINGLITLSSIEEAYLEIIRGVTGEITLSSDFTYEEYNNYPYDINGQITLSSDFEYEIGGPVFITDANGVIIVSGDFKCIANSFEYVLLGTINLSSSPVIENNYNYIIDANGVINASSILLTQMDYDRTVSSVITLSSEDLYYPEIERDVSGLITLSSDFDYELYSKNYISDANGVITLTSDFDYEEVNDYPYIGSGIITITGYFPEEVTTYKYDIEGEIQISSNTTYTWLADSKEVIRVESLISKTMRVESLQCTKILLRGLVNKKNKLNARL